MTDSLVPAEQRGTTTTRNLPILCGERLVLSRHLDGRDKKWRLQLMAGEETVLPCRIPVVAI